MKMERAYLHTAEYYKNYFDFLDWPARRNIGHHFQFIEYLYKKKREDEPTLTILSLVNNTLIIEMFAIVECILDNLLINLLVSTDDKHAKFLLIEEYAPANKIISQALYYELITKEIAKKIEVLSKYRNTVHIKRQSPKKKYEYEAYTDTDLNENEKIFKDFLEFLWDKYDIDTKFDWPDSSFGKIKN